MVETGIPVSTWLGEDHETIMLALFRVEEIREERGRRDRSS